MRYRLIKSDNLYFIQMEIVTDVRQDKNGRVHSFSDWITQQVIDPEATGFNEAEILCIYQSYIHEGLKHYDEPTSSNPFTVIEET